MSVWAGFGASANDRYNDSVAGLRASGASVQTMLEVTYTNADRDDRLLRFFALQTMGEVGDASALAFLDVAARDPNDLDPPPIPPELVNEDIAAPWSEEYVLRITAVHSICDTLGDPDRTRDSCFGFFYEWAHGTFDFNRSHWDNGWGG